MMVLICYSKARSAFAVGHRHHVQAGDYRSVTTYSHVRSWSTCTELDAYTVQHAVQLQG